MSALVISLLWALFWSIVLAGVIYLVLYGIKEFIYAIPGKLEQGIWFLFLILVLIFFISVFAGGGTYVPRPFR